MDPVDATAEPERQSLRAIVEEWRARSATHTDRHAPARDARTAGRFALFVGPSSTGKTMAAEMIAGELKLNLYRVDLTAVMSTYIGETEKNLRRIFEDAERAGAILYMDEADALFGKRSDIKDSHDRYATIDVGWLLARMEAYQGLAVLATNLRENIDDAFLRRIRHVVSFAPTVEQRR
jgi:SpoVK/Ycf46/Vps4 family AAA+-type ATPase